MSDERKLEIRRTLLDAVVSPESVVEHYDDCVIGDDALLADSLKGMDGWDEHASFVRYLTIARDCGFPGVQGGGDLSIRLNQAVAAEAEKSGATREQTIQALAVAMLRICAGAY